MSKQHQLKQACQYIMNAIIQNSSFELKDMIGQDEQFSIIGGQYIMINLDKQSESYGLFASGPKYESHWIGRMLDHLDKAHPSFPIQIRQSTFAQQLISFLIAEEQKPNEETRPSEAMTTIDNIKLPQIVLYSKTLKFALLLITFQAINTHVYITIIRNFHGQIIELSFHSSHESKYQTLLNSLLLFQSPFLILFDIIDINSSQNHHTLKQQLIKLSQTVPLAYFIIKTKDPQATFSPSKSFCYDLECNTLFSHENYNKRPTLSISQTEKNKIQQSFIEYYEIISQQERKKLPFINLEPKALFKGILRINYERKIQTSNHQKDQIKLKDFIKSEFYIFIAAQMKQNPQSSKEKHEKQPLSILANCLPCRKSCDKDVPASSICRTCSKKSTDDVYFCDQCFEAYHKSRHLLFDSSDPKVSGSSHSQSRDADQHGLYVNEKDKEHERLKQQHRKSEKIKKIRQAQLIEEKQPQLTQNQKQSSLKLQKSASKLIELIGSLKNPDLLYKCKYPEATSEKQYQAQLKNQLQFHKIIDKTIVSQVQMFQNSVLLQISSFRQSQIDSKSEKKSEKIESKPNTYDENLKPQKMDLEEPDMIEQESSRN